MLDPPRDLVSPSGETAKTDRTYGVVAACCGVALLWFALWTILVNALVLSGTTYPRIVWCLAVVTVATAALAGRFFPRVVEHYGRGAASAEATPTHSPKPLVALGLVGAALVSAVLINKVHQVALVVVVMAGLSYAAWRLWPADSGADATREAPPLLALVPLFLLICGLYYFGNWPDWDDATYVNLAVGAQHTKGLVYQFDTMLGDGPGPIHLPSYKLHTFELLGAALSTITGLEPITTLHLLMPLPQLAILAAVLFLLFRPILGAQWPVGALFTLAFLYGVTETYGTWGVHGILRFQQGKGTLVTVLVPLTAALTARWFLRREKLDLLALALCHVCAVGCSANGLYLTPITSAFVGAAFLWAPSRAQLTEAITAALWLAPTITYPAALAVVVLVAHLALPSEVAGRPDAYESFRFVTGWRFGGIVALALLPLGALPVLQPRLRRAIAVLVPLVLLIVLNPIGWSAALAATGNLGFRFLWALPAAFLAGLAAVGLGRRLWGQRLLPGLLAASLSLGAGVVYNAKFVEPPYRTRWDLPGLRVVHADFDEAAKVAALVPKRCDVLVPERVAVWLSTMPNAPAPVFVRSVYLTHYRFTMPPDELALRQRLFDLEEGPAQAPAPTPGELQALGVNLGLIAFDPGDAGEVPLSKLATELGLERRGQLPGGLIYWQGDCREQPRGPSTEP